MLECGGNLYDALSIAVKAALHDTRYKKRKCTLGVFSQTMLNVGSIYCTTNWFYSASVRNLTCKNFYVLINTNEPF